MWPAIALALSVGVLGTQVWLHRRERAWVKAMLGKWVFVNGGGRTLAALQYCALCHRQAARWRMVPDEGPVCEVCCEKGLA